MSSWITVCALSELTTGEARIVELKRPGGRGPRRQAMVVKLDSGELRAYHNVCKHLPVPLDSFRGRVLADDKTHFLCRTHGACFRLDDGVCYEGPCRGDSLDPIAVRVDQGTLEVEDSV